MSTHYHNQKQKKKEIKSYNIYITIFPLSLIQNSTY